MYLTLSFVLWSDSRTGIGSANLVLNGVTEHCENLWVVVPKNSIHQGVQARLQ